jgi:hypothetical protein
VRAFTPPAGSFVPKHIFQCGAEGCGFTVTFVGRITPPGVTDRRGYAVYIQASLDYAHACNTTELRFEEAQVSP